MAKHTVGFVVRVSWAAAAFLSIAFQDVFAQAVVVPQADVRVVVDASALRTLVQRANGIRWGAYFTLQNPLPFCKSPDVHIELLNPDIKLSGVQSWLSGGSTVAATITGSPHIFTRDPGCLKVGLKGTCTISGCLRNDVTNGLSAKGSCHADILGDFVIDEFPIAWPIRPFSEMTVALPSTSPQMPYRLEFGTFSSSTWQTSDTPLEKQLDVITNLRVLGGQPIQDPLSLVCGADPTQDAFIGREFPSLLLADASFVGSEDLLDFPNSTLGEQGAIAAEDTLQPGEFGGVSISPRFLRGDAEGNGVFQRLLPIRISGSKQVGSKELEFEVIITDARAVPGKAGNQDALLLGTTIGRASAWIKSKRKTTEVAITNVGVDAIATSPSFTLNGTVPDEAILSMKFLEFRLSLSGDVQGAKICIDGEDLSKGMQETQIKIARYVGADALLPQCLNVGTPNAAAFRKCPDGQQIGRMSLENPELNFGISLDLGSARTTISSRGRLQIAAKPKVQK